MFSTRVTQSLVRPTRNEKTSDRPDSWLLEKIAETRGFIIVERGDAFPFPSSARFSLSSLPVPRLLSPRFRPSLFLASAALSAAGTPGRPGIEAFTARVSTLSSLWRTVAIEQEWHRANGGDRVEERVWRRRRRLRWRRRRRRRRGGATREQQPAATGTVRGRAEEEAAAVAAVAL